MMSASKNLTGFDRPLARPTEYSIDELTTLLNDLYPVSSKWKIVGIHLHVPVTELDLIHTDNDNTLDRLCATLTRRLRQSPIPLSELCKILRMPSVGASSLANILEGKTLPDTSPPEEPLNISSVNVLHCIQPQISETVFPYTLLKNNYPTHVPFGLFIFLQIFTVLDDKVFRPKSYTVEEYTNRVVFFFLNAFLLVVIPSVCYVQLCYLGKLEKKLGSSNNQITLSNEAARERTKIFKDRKVSLNPLKFIKQFKPLLKFKGIEITDYQVLIHSIVFPVFLYYLGLFHSTHATQPIGALQSWRQRLKIHGIQVIEVWQCFSISVILFLSGTLKDLYCLENHLATLISETTSQENTSTKSRVIFQAVRHRWLLVDLYLYGTSIFYALLTVGLLMYGNSFIPKYHKIEALDQHVWNVLTVLITIMQLGGSSASPDVKAFSIVGYFAIPLITCTTLYISDFAHQTGVQLHFATGNMLLLLFITQLVSVLSWLLCLFHCYWRQNELKTWSYHTCIVAIAIVILCLATITVREFKQYNFNNLCACECEYS